VSDSTPEKDRLVRAILDLLTPAERSGSVVYLADAIFPGGTRLAFPRSSIQVPWNAAVAFIDRDPMANWTHSARFLLINPDTGETASYETQLPPFGSDPKIHWRVIYKAPSIPDSMVNHPS